LRRIPSVACRLVTAQNWVRQVILTFPPCNRGFNSRADWLNTPAIGQPKPNAISRKSRGLRGIPKKMPRTLDVSGVAFHTHVPSGQPSASSRRGIRDSCSSGSCYLHECPCGHPISTRLDWSKEAERSGDARFSDASPNISLSGQHPWESLFTDFLRLTFRICVLLGEAVVRGEGAERRVPGPRG
jgi:hypothetical protein